MTAISILTWLIDVTMRATVPLVAAFVCLAWMRRRSAAQRHAVALTGLLVAMWVLGVAIVRPGTGAWVTPADWAQLPGATERTTDARSLFTATAMGKQHTLHPAAEPPPIRGMSIQVMAIRVILASGALIAWNLGMIPLLLRFLHGIHGALSLPRWAAPVTDPRLLGVAQSCCRQLGLRKVPPLLFLPVGVTPMAWGPPGSYVMLPTAACGWSDARLRTVLLHELAHIARLDAPMQAVARLLCAILWFHPLVWRLRARLVRDQERACDDRVVGAGEAPARYARHLLSLVTHSSKPSGLWAALPGTLGRHDVAERIRSLLDGKVRRERLAGSQRLAVSVAALALGCGLVFGPGLVSPAWGSSASKTTAPVLDATSAEEVVESFQSDLDEMGIPGAVIIMVKDGEVILARGFGVSNVDTARVVDVERTVFRLGSITKVITAIALLQALERHGVGLEHPVSELTPGLPVPSIGGQPVTPRHLLTHTGGFDQLGYGRHARAAYELLPLGLFLQEHLVAQRLPGSVSTYDTYGITLAGHLVERLSGTTYSAAVTADVFRRLGMRHSGFHVPGATDEEVAVGYAGRGDQMRPQRWEFHHTVPASSANSTGADMARLMISLLDDCKVDGKQWLTPATCRAMLSQQFSNHPDLPGYGFGFFTERRGDLRIAHHGGNMEGYISLLLLLPDEKVGLFVAANREDGRLPEGAKQWLLQTFYPEAVETTKAPPRPADVDVSRFTGKWISTLRCHGCSARDSFHWRADPIDVTDDGAGNLRIRDALAEPVDRLVFQREDGPLVAFREDASGRVSHMFIRQSVYERYRETPASSASPSP